jgi:hypothetical protein
MGSKQAAGLTGAAIAVMLLVQPAVAGDWSISAVSTTELNIAENRALREDSQGISFAHVGDLAVDFDYAMPDGNFEISTDLRTYRFFGKAKDDGENDYLPHIGVAWLKNSRTNSLTLTADYRIENVTVQDVLLSGDPLAEPIFIPVDTVKHTLSAGLEWAHKIDRRNTLTFDNLMTSSNYNSSVGTDNLLVASTVSWERKLSQRTTGTLTAGVDLLSLDDAASTNRITYSLDGEISTRLSKRLTATIGAGVNLIDTSRNGVDPDALLSGDFSFALDYSMKNTRLGFTADYGVIQGALGDLQNQLATALTVTHTINERSNLSATARLVMSEGELGGGLGSDYAFYFSPTYSLDLTDEWTMKAGYRFIRKNAEYTANSNTVFVSMTRDFVVLP